LFIILYELLSIYEKVSNAEERFKFEESQLEAIDKDDWEEILESILHIMSIEATLDYALEISCKNADTFVQGEGSMIENVYRNQKKVQEVFNINSDRPIWELQKYYPKTYERMEGEFAKTDALFIDKLLEKGWQEGLFRKDINVNFYKVFYTSVQRLRSITHTFPEGRAFY